MAFTYEQLLQRQPKSTSGGDKVAARAFVVAISAYITEHASDAAFDPSQKNYLYKLRAKWELRAQGKDLAWDQYGSTPGRRKKVSAKDGIDRSAYGSEEELDPLLAETLRKWGTPKRTDVI